MAKKLMIFIDGSNLFKTFDNFRQGYRIDYLKLVEHLANGYDLIRTYYYASTAVPPIETQTKFYQKLQYEGFDVTTKPLKKKSNTVRAKCTKCDHEFTFSKITKQEKGVDVALAVDLVSHGYKDNYEEAVLVSGDQDMINAIETVRDRGKRIKVAMFKVAFANELKRHCDGCIFLDDVADDLELK